MPASANRKQHPLSMRLQDADIEIIDRAAGLRGTSRSEFMRDAAVRAAEETLLESLLVRMSPTGFEAFARAIGGPGAPAPEIVELLSRVPPWAADAGTKK